jgi:hypothetical protein
VKLIAPVGEYPPDICAVHDEVESTAKDFGVQETVVVVVAFETAI